MTCLDTGVEEIDYIARPSSSRSMTESELSATESSVDVQDNHEKQGVKVIDDSKEIAQMDEVFEAFIAQDLNPNDFGFEDDFVSAEEKQKSKREMKQSKRVLEELKSVLIGKEKEFEVREARAVARQQKVEKEDDESIHDQVKSAADTSVETDGFLSVPKSLMTTNILGT